MSQEANTTQFYIFPLTNINLFPFTTKPLHIFEPRYIAMVHNSIQTGMPIALCFVPEGSSEIRPVAGYAIPQIIETKPDRTLLIFMAGQGKVKLDLSSLVVSEGISTMVGSIMLETQKELSQAALEKSVLLSESLVRWVTQHIADPIQRDFFIKGLRGPREIVGAFAAYLIFDYDLQYEVMALPSLEEQIYFLHRLLLSGQLSR